MIAASAAVTGPDSCPVRLPGAWADQVDRREPLWFDYGNGTDRPEPAATAWLVEPSPDVHTPPAPPERFRGGTRVGMPRRTRERLDALPYPRTGGPGADLDVALSAAFGVQWHDVDNPYNVHRGYASPRCLYPVQPLVRRDGAWWLHDVDGHARVRGPAAAGPDGTVALVGRYTRVPRGYRWARGTLVALEQGIMLRSLATALRMVGLDGGVRLPSAADEAFPVESGLTATGSGPTAEWSLPLLVETGRGSGGGAPAPRRDPDGPVRPGPVPSDPGLDEVVAVNRAQSFPPVVRPLGPSVPAGAAAAPDGASWGEVLWRRSSGRVVRGMRGIAARPARLPAAALTTMLAWAGVAPPAGPLAAAARHLTLTVALHDADGRADGVYAVRDGVPHLTRPDPAVQTRLEELYGFPGAPDVGCDVRHCGAVWLIGMRPRPLMDELGPGGWTAGLHAAGWITHGLSVGAAAHGLFARPVRAFREIPTMRLAGRPGDEMLVLAVVVGVTRHVTTGQLDLRP